MNRNVTPSLTACLALLWLTQGAPLSGADGGSEVLVRFLVSTTIVSEVNANDARATLRIWAGVIEKQSGLKIDQTRGLLASPVEVLQAVRNGLVDGFAATVPEYVQMAAYCDPDLFVLDNKHANGGEEYLILAHAATGIRSAPDLRGRSLIVHDASVTCLADAWLRVLLAQVAGGGRKEFFGTVARDASISRGVVLPVFFRKADACLVARSAFDTMCELNPQLARELRIVAKSPKVVPVLTGFHRNCPAESKKKLSSALVTLQHSIIGGQVLTLFQSRGIVAGDSSALRGTLEMLSTAERIKAGVADAKR
jgi:ABC-type phosphate/phosphonate transport system substrate-binding protein